MASPSRWTVARCWLPRLPTYRPGAPTHWLWRKLDRLSRSVQDFAGLLNRAKVEGWAVMCLDLGIDTSTSNGRMVAPAPVPPSGSAT